MNRKENREITIIPYLGMIRAAMQGRGEREIAACFYIPSSNGINYTQQGISLLTRRTFAVY